MNNKDIVMIFKENRIRITPQRIGIYEILVDGRKHLTAEEIYEKITDKFPALSLATVYSVLGILRERGLVREIRIRFDKSYFDARIEPHHHFLCKRCGEVFDVDIPMCSTLKDKELDGNIIEEFQGYFYGVCKNCRGDLK